MRAYVGVTDNRWYDFLAQQGFDEVNFWKPGGRGSFRALEPGELFLFKLHAPLNFIVGGGWFVRFSHLPTFLAWEAFGQKNGTATFIDFEKSIAKYRGASLDVQAQIGCIILASPFFFSKDEWIAVPQDWKPNIVQGKTYDDSTFEGRTLLDQVLRQISKDNYAEEVAETPAYERGRLGILRPGQGAFRVMVTDAYNRRCAISGERTLPVLDAAHIIPFSERGSNSVTNGLLLRKDIHTLYDAGYITVTDDYHVEVSRNLEGDYGNGRIYYAYHGLLLPNIPHKEAERPDIEALRWHNERVYRG